MTQEQAVEDHPESGERCDQLYGLLGETEDAKAWLARSLAKTLKSLVYRPEDYLESESTGSFLRGVYQVVLSRDPSPDDLATRVSELAQGKTREAFVNEINESEESGQRRLGDVLDHLRSHTDAGS